MEPKRNITLDSRSIKRKMLKLKKSTLIQKTPLLLSTTSSQHGLLTNIKGFLDIRDHKISMLQRTLSILMFLNLLTLSTGETKAQSIKLKIKEDADLAGHSQQQQLSKATISFKLETFFPYLSNSLLTVIQLLTDVMVDGKLMLSNML